MRATDQPALAVLRERIDALDRHIATLLQERAEVSLAIGRVKGDDDDAPVLVPDREKMVLLNVQSVAGPLSPESLGGIYREILSASRGLQRPTRVAFLGPAATFGHQAALDRFGRAAVLEPCASNIGVIDAVEKGAADYGLVPVENSTEGPVNDVLDRLVDSPLRACAEVTIPVAQALMSRATSLTGVRRIMSHPQAAAQARNWLNLHLPGVEVEPVSSTGRAAEMAADDPTVAAIGPRLGAELFGLNVLEDAIQDLADNSTRFLVMARKPSERSTGHDKTMVVFSIRDRVGALRDIADAFAEEGVNLLSIQSRPSRRKAWDYLFFVELDGHLSEPRVRAAIERAEGFALFFKIIGSWPVMA